MKMKQRWDQKVILWLAVLLCGIAAVIWLSSIVRQTADQVTITEEVLYGDPSLVEGMAVQIRTRYKDTVKWTTDFVIGQEEESRTIVEYRSGQEPEDLAYLARVLLDDIFYVRPMLDNVSFDIDKILFPVRYKREVMEWMTAQYGEMLEGIAARCEPGGSAVQTVWLKEYFDSYPICVTTSSQWRNMGVVRDGKTYLPKGTVEWAKLVSQKLQEYFPIPIVEDDRLTILMEKDEKGDIASVSFKVWTGAPGGRGSFCIVTDAGIYFTLNMSPEHYDYSQVPGGYGLYFLPTVVEDGNLYVVLDELTTVMPLDPDQGIRRAWSDAAGETLVMSRYDSGDSLEFDIIDVASQKIIQTIGCGATPEWDRYDGDPGTLYRVLVKDDFMLIELSTEAFLLYEQQPDGTYQFAFAGDPARYESMFHQWHRAFHVIPYDNVGIDYNGEYLAVSWFMPYNAEDISSGESCDIYVAVYGQEGLVYYGAYRNSLSVGGKGEYEYSGERVTQAVVDPISLTWPSKGK